MIGMKPGVFDYDKSSEMLYNKFYYCNISMNCWLAQFFNKLVK